jgi:hypothetical protein
MSTVIEIPDTTTRRLVGPDCIRRSSIDGPSPADDTDEEQEHEVDDDLGRDAKA